MIAFGEIERTGEKDDVAYFRVLFQNSPEDNEENYNRPQPVQTVTGPNENCIRE